MVRRGISEKVVSKVSAAGLPRSLHGKEPPARAGDVAWISGSRRFPGGENNSFQYSCLENPMDRGVWRATDRTEDLATVPAEKELIVKTWAGSLGP